MFASEEELVRCWKSFLPVERVRSEQWDVWPCSSQAVAVSLHWFRGRSVPCVAAACACPACVTPARPLMFVGCQRLGPKAETLPPRVLELPISAWTLVRKWADRQGGLLRVRFQVFRHGGRRGKVVVDSFGLQEGKELLSEFEVVSALCRLWNIPAPRVGELSAEWLTRVGVAISCDGHYKAK